MAVESTLYRLAPPVRVRFVGLYLVAMAVLVFGLTIVLIAANITMDVMVAVVLASLIGLVVVSWWFTSKAYIVQVTADGYEVRLVRGAGVKVGRWAGVEDAVTSSANGVECLVLRLKNGGTTTIPLELIADRRDEFIRDVAARIRSTR